MESPLSFFRTHWDHEPPLARPSATLSPSDVEREGVRGRFMERAGEMGFHRIGAANWNPLSLTLSPLLRRGERESTSDMVEVSRYAHVSALHIPSWRR